MTSVAFTSGRLGPLTLRNRVIKTATFEGMTPRGVPTDALVAHHRAVAAGGVGMTTVAYCAVSADARTFGDQRWMRAEVVPALSRLTDAVHAEGAAVAARPLRRLQQERRRPRPRTARPLLRPQCLRSRRETEGVDALVLSGGVTSRTPFYLFRGRPSAGGDDRRREEPPATTRPAPAGAARDPGVSLRAALLSRPRPRGPPRGSPAPRAARRALGLDDLDTAMREGFEFVAMGRALIADPDLVVRLQRGTATRSRCTSCDACVAAMDRGGVRCILG